MTFTAQANHAMIAAADAADQMFVKLTKARERGAKPLVIAGLTAAYDQHNARMNQLWDMWNDAMRAERLAKIYK